MVPALEILLNHSANRHSVMSLALSGAAGTTTSVTESGRVKRIGSADDTRAATSCLTPRPSDHGAS